MPGTQFTLPADALEKADAKVKAGVDHYADLTDEERTEEDLPPREPAKGEEPKPPAEPAKTEPDKPAAEPEKKPAAKEPEPEDEIDPAVAALFEEIASLREDITSSLGEPEPAKVGKEDPLIAAAKEHEDPVVRGLAERLEKAEQALAQEQKSTRTDRIEKQLEKDNAERAEVQSHYVIAGKPMTDEQMEQVEDFEIKNPELARRLSVAQITRVVFPDAMRAAEPTKPDPAPAIKPGKAGDDGSPAATIVDTGVSGPGPAQPWKPGPNETIESAMDAAKRRFYPQLARR